MEKDKDMFGSSSASQEEEFADRKRSRNSELGMQHAAISNLPSVDDLDAVDIPKKKDELDRFFEEVGTEPPKRRG